jgi:putative membrane protein
MRRTTITAATGLGLALALLAAQATTAQQPAGTLTDDEFVAKAAIGGSTEVALSKLALRQASSQDVKTFAQQMVTDHTAANKELLTLAGKKQIPVPRAVDAKHQAAVDKLGKLEGAEFDKAYAHQMVLDHKETVALFQAQAESGQDADLKGLATKLLPKLKHHLQMARNLAGEKDEAAGRTSGTADQSPAPSK